MPVLQNTKYEAFAIARANGAMLEDAYEAAGFVANKSHACRLAQRPEVAERVAEIRHELARIDDTSPQAFLALMMSMAVAAEGLKTPAAVKEARVTLLEAHRLATEMAAQRRSDRAAMSFP